MVVYRSRIPELANESKRKFVSSNSEISKFDQIVAVRNQISEYESTNFCAIFYRIFEI